MLPHTTMIGGGEKSLKLKEIIDRLEVCVNYDNGF